MLTRISYCCTFLCLFTPIHFIQAQDAQAAKAVDELFSPWSGTYSPGCAVAVIKDGKIIHKKGYGMADLEHDIPIRPSSIFYIGSVSKQFVAACMLLLDEQGKIDLDEDLRTYIPEFPDYGYKITIRHLIHHTSGIRDNLTLWNLVGRSHLEEIPEEEIFDMICRQKELNFEPGTRYMYSNSCYFLMSIIIKRASGLSLREYADKHIFQPLGMHHSIFGDNNRRIIRNRAFAYGKNPDGSFNSMLMRFDLVGSGGLYSSVEDLFLWDQNFYDNKIGKRGQAFIDDLLTNGKFKDGSPVDYAFALVNGSYKGLRTISHSGALGGYRAFFIQFPTQRFSVIILSNLEIFQPQQLAEKVADIYLADQLQVVQKQEKKEGISPNIISLDKKEAAMADYHEVKPATSAAMKKLAGSYYSPELDTRYQIKLEKEQLWLKLKNQGWQPMTRVKENLYTQDAIGQFYFTFGKAGKVEGFRLDAGRVRNLKFSKVD